MFMKFGLLLFSLLTNVCLGATVAHYAESDVNYFRAANTNVNSTGEAGWLSMVFEASSGGGTAESSPHVAYVPANDTSGSDDQSANNILSNNTIMPTMTSGTLAANLRILVQTTPASGESETVQVALEDDSGDYRKINTTVSEYSTDLWRITIDLATACSSNGSSVQECTDLQTQADGSKEETLKFYVFASDSIAVTGDIVDPTSGFTGGIFYSVNFSDKVPSGTLTLNSITKGDGRLTLNVSGGNSITNMSSSIIYRSVIFQNATGSTTAQGEGVGDIIQSDTAVREGSIEVKNLNNNQTYTLSTSLVNKYQFATTSTNAISETPLEIEALLKSQACYLVTAGFQREHYVLDYFRAIRDNYLLKFTPTKKLVDLYYATAPSYAPVIYNSPKLSLIVRSLSYGVYFFLKFFWYIFALGLIVLTFRLRNFRLNIAS
jgi:hypothetical protein